MLHHCCYSVQKSRPIVAIHLVRSRWFTNRDTLSGVGQPLGESLRMPGFTESVVEQAALAWLEGLGYTTLSGPDIAPGQPDAERDDYGQVILDRRLRQALQRLNPS